MPRAFKICPDFLDRSYFYKMKAVINSLRWGAPPPHTPLDGAAPQTPRFFSGIESLLGNKPVYKIKNKSKKHKNSIEWRSGFHLENLAKSYKSNISENTHFYIIHPSIK